MVEAIIFKNMLDKGKIDKLEDECYGTDAWKHRIRSMVPENGAIPILFLVFIISTPILLVSMILGLLKK